MPFTPPDLTQLHTSTDPSTPDVWGSDLKTILQSMIDELVALDAGGGGGGGGPVTAADITDATTLGRTLIKIVDAAAARTAIGAGTSSLVLGTSGTTAAAGNDARLSDQRTPADATVTNAKVATGAAINVDKTADGTTNKVYTATEKTKLAALPATAVPLLAPTAVKTSAYTAAAAELVLCDATAGTFNVTLPTAPADGTQIGIKKVDNSANLPTAVRGGTDTFESGSTSFGVSTQYRAVIWQYKASTGIWYAVAMYLSVASLAIPNALSDLTGTVTAAQLPASMAMTKLFTAANAATVTRPTARTDLQVIWIGDATTTSSTLPANRIAGDIVLTTQA